ncbi:MAG: hypothetical protein IPN95_13760 [Bacteroidetes bacterium]|nr:hypothetical protein [Bacteroidota bacterium]
MAATVFYPPLSSIVQLDFLPEQLDFIHTGLSRLLNDLYYKDLQVSIKCAWRQRILQLVTDEQETTGP